MICLCFFIHNMSITYHVKENIARQKKREINSFASSLHGEHFFIVTLSSIFRSTWLFVLGAKTVAMILYGVKRHPKCYYNFLNRTFDKFTYCSWYGYSQCERKSCVNGFWLDNKRQNINYFSEKKNDFRIMSVTHWMTLSLSLSWKQDEWILLWKCSFFVVKSIALFLAKKNIYIRIFQMRFQLNSLPSHQWYSCFVINSHQISSYVLRTV